MNYRRGILMRCAALLLLGAASASAQGMPRAKHWETWKSPKVKRRLLLPWEALPDHTERTLPDGTATPATAEWPFVLYVTDEDTRERRKIRSSILADTRFRLASRACKVVVVKPAVAVELPYLRRIPAIRDPTIIVLRRDFSVVGVLRGMREFTSDRCLRLMASAVDEAYQVKLAAYLGEYFRLLKRGDELWKEERAIELLAERAGKKDPARKKQFFDEVERREAVLEAEEGELAAREADLIGSLVLVPEREEPLPATFGTGKEERPLSPKEIAAVETFREFSRHNNPLVRAAAVEDLGAVDSPFIVEVILRAARDVDMRVVEAAGRALGRMRTTSSLAAMRRGLVQGRERQRIAALIGFAEGSSDFPDAVPEMVSLYKVGSGEIRKVAIRALRAQRGDMATEALIGALSDRVPALQVLAAVELGQRKEGRAVPALVGLLGAPHWSLRKAATEALGRIRAKESIEPLLARFAVEEGLLREVIHDALVGITGQDFRYNVEAWRKWWDRYGKSFRVPTEAEIAAAKARAEQAMKGYAPPRKGRRRYHRIETFSRRIVFVLDISSSMQDKIVIPEDAPASAREEFPDRVKIEIAKKELIELLATLDGRVYFNIVTFAGQVRTWKKTLVSGTQRTAAIKWVSRLKPITSGGAKSSGEAQKTNTYGALISAFGLEDKARPNWRARSRVDTIFLVTDGVPTIGKIVEVPKLIRAVTDLNRTKGVVIHVICFDHVTGRRLKPLADQNGGKLVVRGY